MVGDPFSFSSMLGLEFGGQAAVEGKREQQR